MPFLTPNQQCQSTDGNFQVVRMSVNTSPYLWLGRHRQLLRWCPWGQQRCRWWRGTIGRRQSAAVVQSRPSTRRRNSATAFVRRWTATERQRRRRAVITRTWADPRYVYLPFRQVVIIGAMVIVWRGRWKIIGSVLCNIVCNNCAQCTAHTYEQTNSSLDWVLFHWAHFTVLRFICVLCITVYIVCMRRFVTRWVGPGGIEACP